MINILLSKKIIIPVAILSGGLLITSGVLISTNLAVARSVATSQSSQWTQPAGLGISVPACSSSAPSITCVGGTGQATLSWAYGGQHGLCDIAWVTVTGVGTFGGDVGSCDGTKTFSNLSSSQNYPYTISWYSILPDGNSLEIDTLSGSLTIPNCTPPAVSCSVSPSPATIGQSVTWSAVASGGSAPECTNSTGKASCNFNEATAPPSIAITWTAGGSGNSSYVCIREGPLPWSWTGADCVGARGGNQPGLFGSNTFSDILGTPLQLGRNYSYRVNATSCPTPGGTGCSGDNLIDLGNFPIPPYAYSWSGTNGLSGTTASVSKSYPNTGTKTGSVTVTSGSQSATNTCSMTVSTTPTLPDLTAGSISPTSATAGIVTTFSATISNTGTSTGAGFTNLFQRADDPSGTINAQDIGTSIQSTALAAGRTVNASLPYTFPSIDAGTTRYMRACADKSSALNTGVITESDDNNNCGVWTAVSVLVPPSAFDYSLSNSGNSNVTKTSGNAFTTNTITKTLLSVFTQSVTLDVSGEPSGVTHSISNQGCSPRCTSVITFTVPPSTPNGTYPITVTGSPLGRWTRFNLVVSGSPMTVSCSSSPRTALVGELVTWTANVSGGTPPLTYLWSGTNIPTSPAPNTNPFNIRYSTLGQKTTTVTVTDTNSVQATCPSTIQINFNPNFEEF